MPEIDVTNIPAPRVPIVDQDGLVSREWYRYFYNLFVLAGEGGNTISLDDLQVGPPVQEVISSGGGGGGSVNSVTGTAPISSTGGTNPDISISQATTSTNGYLSSTDWNTFNNKANSGANSDITSLSGLTGGITTPEYITFDTTPGTVPTATGSLYWDSADGNQTLSLVMAGTNAVQQIGEETYYRIKASSAITEGQVVMFTGTVGASGALQGAPATGLTAATASYVMGVATENIALNGWGYVTHFGLVRNIDTTGGAEAWVDGQILYYDPTVAGGLTKTVPTAPNAKVQVCAVVHAAVNGSLFVRPAFGGTLGQYEGDVNVSSPASGNTLIYDGVQGCWENADLSAGTGISIGNGAGSITVTNTAPDQTVSISSGTGISVTGTYPNFTVTNTDPSSGGTVTSVAATVPTGLSVSGSPITTSGTLAISYAAGYSIPTTTSQTNWDTAYSDRLKWDGGSTGLVAATGRTSLGGTTVGQSYFTLTNPSAITFPRMNADNSVSALTAADFRTAIGAGTGSGTVTSVTGTSPVVSSGGTTPAISLASGYGDTQNPYASKTANYILAAPNGSSGVPTFRAMVAADVPTLNQNTTGTAANVTGVVAIANGGTGQSSQTAAFDALAPTTTQGDIIYHNGTDNVRLPIGANTYVLTSNGTTVSWSAPAAGGSNITSLGMWENSQTISANYSIASGNSALSSGPITISSGVAVTVPSGSRWVIA